jgi:hypothetical protein
MTCSTLLSASTWWLQPASFGDSQPVPEHEQHQAAVAGFVPGSLGGLNQPLHFAPGQVLPILRGLYLGVNHFVESSSFQKS